MPRQAAIRSAPAPRRSFTPGQIQARQQLELKNRVAAQQNIAARQRVELQRNIASRQNIAARQQVELQRRIASQQNIAGRQRLELQRRVQRNYQNNLAAQRYNNNYNGKRGYRNPYYATVPSHVYRDWDHGREHWWNNHRYGWRGNSWVILNSYGAPYYDSYGYDYSPSVVVSTAPEAVGSSLAADVQSALDREGYDPGPVDGIIGSSTRDAISEYQADHGLAVTGTINSALLQSLGL